MSSIPTPNPTDLITDELVTEALLNDVGTGFKILSWQVKDFTKKGDNYSSCVTSIQVKYEKSGESFEKSYVVKINPLRAETGFTPAMEEMYAREAIVLKDIFAGMNTELNKLGLQRLGTAQLFAMNLKRGKEIFIVDDLRQQGFVMQDRQKAMAVDHAKLVVEELGKFHASSILFEETLSNKSIPGTFPYFEDIWLQEGSKAFQMFNAMVRAQIDNAVRLLSDKPKFEKCLKWLKENRDRGAKLFSDAKKCTDHFSVLGHGDCWTNNILFKYDNAGKPIDVRLVDLQATQKVSPCCDLNYFFYASMSWTTRHNNMKFLKETYYQSFTNVLNLARKSIPFTYEEFEQEMKKRSFLCVFAGIFIVPIVLAEGEDVVDYSELQDDKLDEFLDSQKEKSMTVSSNELFNDRFISMFEDMHEIKFFE